MSDEMNIQHIVRIPKHEQPSTMRVLLCLLVLLPIVWCASIDERFILDSFGLDATSLAKQLQAALGSDTSEAACEAGCPALLATIPGGSLAGGLCGPACKELQHLVQG